MAKEKTIIETSEEAKECKLTLVTPYDTLESKEYLVFAKTEGKKHIEVNGLTLDELREFQYKLNILIKSNEAKLKGELN